MGDANQAITALSLMIPYLINCTFRKPGANEHLRKRGPFPLIHLCMTEQERKDSPQQYVLHERESLSYLCLFTSVVPVLWKKGHNRRNFLSAEF